MTIFVKQNSHSPLVPAFHHSAIYIWKIAAEREGRTCEFGFSIYLTAWLFTFIADSIHSPDLYFQGSKWYKRQTPEEFNITCLCLNRTLLGYAHVSFGHGLVYRLQDNRFLSPSPCEGSSLLKRTGRDKFPGEIGTHLPKCLGDPQEGMCTASTQKGCTAI